MQELVQSDLAANASNVVVQDVPTEPQSEPAKEPNSPPAPEASAPEASAAEASEEPIVHPLSATERQPTPEPEPVAESAAVRPPTPEPVEAKVEPEVKELEPAAEEKPVESPQPTESREPVDSSKLVEEPVVAAEPISVDPSEELTVTTTEQAVPVPAEKSAVPEPTATAAAPKIEEAAPEPIAEPAVAPSEAVPEPSAAEPKVDVDNDVEMADADADAVPIAPLPTAESAAKVDTGAQPVEDVVMAEETTELPPAPTVDLGETNAVVVPAVTEPEAAASRKPSVDNGVNLDSERPVSFDDSPALSPQSPVSTVLRERRTVDRPTRTRPTRQRLSTKLKSDSARATPDAPPTPREGDGDDAMPPPSDAPDGEEEVDGMEVDEREAVLVAGVKAALGKPASCDKTVEDILSWNQEAAPTESSRVPKVGNFHADQLIADIVRPMAAEQAPTATIVARVVVRENHELEEKITYLREEYLELDQLWTEHRELLDKTMEKRGPPPADLYAVPGSVLPPPTPGVVPATPIAEEPSYSGRSNRRRGVGDAVATEAEYQAILAGLADSAAKDPTHRATKTAATIPDMILDKERDFRYEDENNRIDDPLAFYNFSGNAEAIWTDEERDKFLKRYLMWPKQFGKIAEGLPNKSAGDCVLYYYRTKYDNDYKNLLATRRGANKARRSAVAKKKSSALMADLERNKQSTPTPKGNRGRDREGSTSTTATREGGGGRNKRARQGSDMPATPGADTPARKRRPEGEPDVESATQSRAESEAPSTASKTKSRGDKTRAKGSKRPRVTKDVVENAPPEVAEVVAPVPQPPIVQPVTAPAAVSEAPPAPVPVTTTDSSAATQVVDPATGLVVDAVPLLPPVKRARRKKVVEPVDANAPPLDPNAPPPPPGEGGKPRRTTTNSYWSVAEKQKFPELVREHGADFRAIADKLGNTKTVIQVRNHYNQTVDAMRASGIVLPASTQVGVQPVKVNGVEAARETKPVIAAPANATDQPPAQPPQQQAQPVYPARYPQPQGYESYPPGARRTSHEYPEPRRDSFPAEPRMAVFPPSPPHQRVPSPPAPVSRSGGMRISALLNDDPPKDTKPFDTASVVSDGTVDEFDGPAQRRPSPLPGGVYPSYEQQPRRPAFEDRPPSFERGRSFEDRHPSFERGRSFERDHHGSYERGRSFERRPSFDHPDERYQRQYGYPPSGAPPNRHWQQREGPPPPGAFYPPPPHGSAPPAARGGPHWDPAGMPALGVFPPNGSAHPPGAPIHVHSGAPPRPVDYGRQGDWRPYLHTPNGAAAGGHEAPAARGLSPSRAYGHRGAHDHAAPR
ncbi:DNA-binding protein snt1 [Vanrija albida]|uniref:DNA-binding protein snt1 n=1 Tax=Vanrija albida TaxID=181172 RepID=A0ABR3QFV3_9TREE